MYFSTVSRALLAQSAKYCIRLSFALMIILLSIFLLQEVLNDALMGILRVRDLRSPPYISTQPAICVHTISKEDHFVVVASDGLFDFFSNDEVVKLINSFILENPAADPAKLIVEQLLVRAADCAGKFPLCSSYIIPTLYR